MSDAGAERILAALVAAYPEARCELEHRSAFELLVATILSAQSTDARVNQVTPALFARWPGPAELAGASQEEVEETIRSIGMFRNKASNLRAMSKVLIDVFGGAVPRTREELTRLPGVGRKTANVILGNVWDVPAITVDSHVARVATRLGLSASSAPDAIECDLMACLPQASWTRFSHAAIFHGRRTCHARGPACHRCPLAGECGWNGSQGQGS